LKKIGIEQKNTACDDRSTSEIMRGTLGCTLTLLQFERNVNTMRRLRADGRKIRERLRVIL